MAKPQQPAPPTAGPAPVVNSGGAEKTLRGVVASRSDVGKTRSNNEDNFTVFELGKKATHNATEGMPLSLAGTGFLIAVADGMGGHSSGQVASKLCIETLPAEVAKGLPVESGFGDLLRKAIETTNEVIHTAAQQDQANKGMGTTLTAVWLIGRQAVIGQVGDSRAYRLRKGEYTQLTNDQTVLNSVSEAEREALINTPFENMLLQAVGALPHVDADITAVDLHVGDCFLLCSDGLYRVVKPEQMAEVLKRSDSLPQKAAALIQMANDGGGPDNVTVILCEVQAAEAD